MNYEELIKRLRNGLSCYGEKCSSCPDRKNCITFYEHSAADAIEVLSKMENTTRWIPVTERLPKTRESILGKKSSKVIVAFRFDDGTQGTDTAHTLNGEWVFEDHITVLARTITHWIPLPEPPKEET